VEVVFPHDVEVPDLCTLSRVERGYG